MIPPVIFSGCFEIQKADVLGHSLGSFVAQLKKGLFSVPYLFIADLTVYK
jgi:hypothetical protein